MNEKQFVVNNMSLNNPIPTESDIERVIEKLKSKLSIKQINMTKNYAVKEGYERAIENIRQKKDNMDGLKTVQGRAIASMAYDYLQGLCSEDVLCNVPIQMR